MAIAELKFEAHVNRRSIPRSGSASRYQTLVSQFALQTWVGQWQLKNVKCDLKNDS